jgi:hypothetical protein
MSEKTLLHRFPEAVVNPASFPLINLSKLKEYKDAVVNFISDTGQAASSAVSSRVSRIHFPSPNFQTRKILRIVLYVAIGAALIFGLYQIARLVGTASKDSGKVQVRGASATRELNREFSFPLRNDKGEEVSQFKYLLEKAELRDEIIVKGQRASSVKGRTFLIITLKLTNQYNKPIQINTRDFIRLSLNGNQEEWLAPDVHNDAVEVQAISTKFTRVGFPINTTDTNLTLRVGEIEGDKQLIELSF